MTSSESRGNPWDRCDRYFLLPFCKGSHDAPDLTSSLTMCAVATRLRVTTRKSITTVS
jgi:hypothetical protein